MKDWTIDDEGHRWTVQLDVRDLGGHLDATKRARAATLARRATAVLGKVPVVGALPLGFGGKLRILRTMHTPAALHGCEASHFLADPTGKLRTAYVGAVTSGSMPLANPGAVLSLLDGHPGCDPGYQIVWCRFRLLRRFMAKNAEVLDLVRIYGLLSAVSGGAPGHGPIHLLLQSASDIGFGWDPVACVWNRPGLPPLDHIASPFQYLKTAILDAWNGKVCGDLGERAGFRGGTLLDLKGSLQLLSASHLRERDRGLLRGILSGGVWNGFLLGHARGEIVPCRFCGEADGDGHLFWDCTHSPFVHIRENPEFHGLLSRDKSTHLVVVLLGRFLFRILLLISFIVLMELFLTISCMIGMLISTSLIPPY